MNTQKWPWGEDLLGGTVWLTWSILFLLASVYIPT